MSRVDYTRIPDLCFERRRTELRLLIAHHVHINCHCSRLDNSIPFQYVFFFIFIIFLSALISRLFALLAFSHPHCCSAAAWKQLWPGGKIIPTSGAVIPAGASGVRRQGVNIFHRECELVVAHSAILPRALSRKFSAFPAQSFCVIFRLSDALFSKSVQKLQLRIYLSVCFRFPTSSIDYSQGFCPL